MATATVPAPRPGETIQQNERVEPIVKLLCMAVFILLAVLIGVARFFPSDGQTFQVVAGLLSAFSGAFFMRIKPKDGPPGKTGDTGDTGETGSTGATGATGATGRTP